MTDRSVYIINDDPRVCEVLRAGLAQRQFEAVSYSLADELAQRIASDGAGVLVTDMSVRCQDGQELYRKVLVDRLDTPVIVTTSNPEAGIVAIRAGAYDFVASPVDIDVLALSVARAHDHRALREEVKRLRRPPVAVDAADPSRLLSMEEVQHRYVAHVLEAVRGNKALAARVLGMDRRTLYRKLDRWRDASHATV
jgi:DNA-binding NtrC family response regulator